MRPLLVFLVGLACAPHARAVASAQAPARVENATKPVEDEVAAEWRALRRAIATARPEWERARPALAEHPARALLERAERLAERVKDPSLGVPVLVECARLASVLEPAGADRALARLLDAHLGDAALGSACEALGAAADELGLERVETFLQGVRAKTKSDGVRAGAEHGRARARFDALDGLPPDGPARLRALLRALAAQRPTTRRSRAATDLLFAWADTRVMRAAPEPDARDTAGAPVRLADLRGKAVLVVFWSTPDAATRATLAKHTARLARLRERPFALLGVHAEAEPEADEALDPPLRAFLDHHGRVAPGARQELTAEERALHDRIDALDRAHTTERLRSAGIEWRTAVDGALDGPWSRRWDVRGFPSTWVLDAEGKLRFRDLPDDELDRALDTLVAEADTKR
ncbi:MAG: redoxin domain-containing protein [Planctomycetes bacterium]|nr:redoxin domain-containing protein [Planctomycetota bacterium]